MFQRVQRVLLVSHVSPDGDTIGSALALAWALRKRGITCRLSCADAVPAKLSFLPGSEDYANRELTDEDAVFLIDISDPQRIGTEARLTDYDDVPTIVIDHHATNNGYGDINIVRPCESTAQVVLQLFDALDVDLDERIATCLLAGLVTDTCCFRTSNTTSEALTTAVRLMDAGASLGRITEAVYSHRPMGALGLWGEAMRRARLDQGVLWTTLSRESLCRCEADWADSKGLVEFLRDFDGANVVALFRQIDENTVDISLRSRMGYNVAEVAVAFGGGGHPQAAGCTISAELEVVTRRVLSSLVRVAEEASSAEHGQS